MIFARFVSFISNPIFIFVSLPFFLVYKTTNDFSTALIWTMYTMAYIFLFVTFVFIGVKRRVFSDIDISKREQRPILYITGAILSILYLASLFILHGPQILFITILGIMFGIVMASFVNIKIKASMHVAAISGLLVSLSIIYQGYFLLLIPLVFIIGWSRVKMKRHTVTEVVVGGILGTLLSLVMYFLSKLLYK